MNAINNNSVNFTARIRVKDGLGNKTFDKACKAFEAMTKDCKDTLYVWKGVDSYKFDLAVKNTPSPTSQNVGKDTIGYLHMEEGYKGIANFLKTTLEAVKVRQKYATTNDFRGADLDAAGVYLRDKNFSEVFKTKFRTEVGYNISDYEQAGACVHVKD